MNASASAMKRLQKKQFQSKDDLWKGLILAGEQVQETDEVGKLFASMGRRLEAVRQARGGPTRY